MRLAALVLWAAAILWFSIAPNPPRPPDVLSWDKLRHAAAYGVLTFLAGWALAPFFPKLRRGWLWAVCFAVAYGAVIELAQGLLSDVRKADPLDALANTCGAAAVFALVRLWSGLTGKGRP
jgi:VanZ family protein